MGESYLSEINGKATFYPLAIAGYAPFKTGNYTIQELFYEDFDQDTLHCNLLI